MEKKMNNIGGIVTNDQKFIKEQEAEEKARYLKEIEEVEKHLDSQFKPMFQREPIPANEKPKFLRIAARYLNLFTGLKSKLPDQPESENNRPVLEKLRAKYTSAIEQMKAQKESLQIDIDQYETGKYLNLYIDLGDYIKIKNERPDMILKSIIENKTTPTGKPEAEWIDQKRGGKADAVRFCNHLGIKIHEFNKCFQMYDSKPLHAGNGGESVNTETEINEILYKHGFL